MCQVGGAVLLPRRRSLVQRGCSLVIRKEQMLDGRCAGPHLEFQKFSLSDPTFALCVHVRRFYIEMIKEIKMTKLFVGSLPFETSEDQLHAMFASHGSVASAKIISDRETGRSRGFGFVEMADDAQAKSAIQMLNGSTVGARQIVVNVAKPMEKREGGFNRGNRGNGGNRW